MELICFTQNTPLHINFNSLSGQFTQYVLGFEMGILMVAACSFSVNMPYHSMTWTMTVFVVTSVQGKHPVVSSLWRVICKYKMCKTEQWLLWILFCLIYFIFICLVVFLSRIRFCHRTDLSSQHCNMDWNCFYTSQIWRTSGLDSCKNRLFLCMLSTTIWLFLYFCLRVSNAHIISLRLAL